MSGPAQQLDDSFKQLQGAAGLTVTYTRGDRAVTLSAVPGSTSYEAETGDVIETMQSRDFLVLSSDLKFGATPVLPERGDSIRETIDGVETRYEVRAPAGSKHFRFADPFRRVIRIHTTQTS